MTTDTMPTVLDETEVGRNHFFRGADAEVARKALPLFTCMAVAEGEVICEEGDPSDFLYLICDGTVRISKRGRGGQQEPLASLEAGDFFGEMGLYDTSARSARATAASAARLARIDRAGVERVMQIAPLQISRNVLGGLVDRLRATDAHLIQQVLEAERLSMLGSMAAAIVHDLKNPISIIVAAAQMLAERTEDRQLVQLSGLVHRSVDRMHGMVQEILEFSRGHTQLDLMRIPLGVLTAQLDDQILLHLPARGIRVEKQVTYEGALKIDIGRIVRVFDNLIRNAAEAMPDGGTLTLVVAGEGDKVRIEIADTGPGIPEEIRANLFDPFVTHGKVHGTGLGMAIVRSIVEAHRGTIQVFSEPGRGARFEILLPAGEEAAAAD